MSIDRDILAALLRHAPLDSDVIVQMTAGTVRVTVRELLAVVPSHPDLELLRAENARFRGALEDVALVAGGRAAERIRALLTETP